MAWKKGEPEEQGPHWTVNAAGKVVLKERRHGKWYWFGPDYDYPAKAVFFWDEPLTPPEPPKGLDTAP